MLATAYSNARYELSACCLNLLLGYKVNVLVFIAVKHVNKRKPITVANSKSFGANTPYAPSKTNDYKQ